MGVHGLRRPRRLIAVEYNDEVVGGLVLDEGGANTIVVKAYDYGSNGLASSYTEPDYIEVYNEKYPNHAITWGGEKKDDEVDNSAQAKITILDTTAANSVTVEDDPEIGNFDSSTTSGTSTSTSGVTFANTGTITIKAKDQGGGDAPPLMTTM